MNKINIYDDLYFNGKKLSDFGGILHNQYESARTLLPTTETSTISIPGIDGEIPFETRYGIREWTEDFYFEDMVDIREIAGWLGAKECSDFYYINDDIKIKAKVSDTVDFEVYCNGCNKDRYMYSGLMTISFVAYDPYYQLINPIYYEFSTVGIKHFENKGNRQSLPIIRFEVVNTQNIKFKVNNKLYEVKEVNNWCEIDSRKRSVKDSIGNKRNNFTSEGDKIAKFPVLKIGDNTFELISGSIRNVIIYCNSRFI